jgi:glycosyltransferase involved in cell wall biosynthesis
MSPSAHSADPGRPGSGLPARPLRILLLGPVGGFHVEPMAQAVYERGHEVIVGGPVWDGGNTAHLMDDAIPVVPRTWPTARWLRRLLRETRPDVVHAHWMPVAALALLYGASPLIVSAWGSDVFRAAQAQRLAWRLVVRHADFLVASSDVLLGALQDLGAPADRTMLLNWGVDLAAFSPPAAGRGDARRALGLPSGRLILSPRSGADVYNPEIVLRAFERIADERDDVHLVLLRSADGARAPRPSRHADRVRALGQVPHDEMAGYYRAADVCVSIASSDSSPRSVWEAMACGTPCVLSDIPWVHELVAVDRHALVTAIGEEPVAEAICRLLDDPRFAARISEHARALVEEHRDRAVETRRLCELYERVAVEGRVRSRLPHALAPASAALGELQAVIRRRLRPPARHATPTAPSPGRDRPRP